MYCFSAVNADHSQAAVDDSQLNTSDNVMTDSFIDDALTDIIAQ